MGLGAHYLLFNNFFYELFYLEKMEYIFWSICYFYFFDYTGSTLSGRLDQTKSSAGRGIILWMTQAQATQAKKQGVSVGLNKAVDYCPGLSYSFSCF